MRAVLFAVLVAALAAAPSAAADDHPVVAAVKAKLKNPDKPFTMLVVLKVKPGMQEKFEAAFADARKGTRKEKGNVAYDLNRDSQDDTKYAAYERWKDLDALAVHIKAEHTKKLLDALPDLIDGPPEIHVGVPVAE